MSGDVGTLHNEAQLLGKRAWVSGAGLYGKSVDNVLDGLLVLRRQDVGGFVR
jgi:hypothetical protein